MTTECVATTGSPLSDDHNPAQGAAVAEASAVCRQAHAVAKRASLIPLYGTPGTEKPHLNAPLHSGLVTGREINKKIAPRL
jgi:hypothetical protein